MPTMNVSLPQGLAEFVEQEVQSGAYSTASEVVRDGLRLLREERAAYEEKLAILRREIQLGVDDLDAGRVSTKTIPEIASELFRDRER
jgi:antitoxin ParD1/3/4